MSEYRNNLNHLRLKFDLNYFQARKVMKQFNQHNKKLDKDGYENESLNDYLKPMLDILNELEGMGEFKQPKDNPKGLLKSQKIKIKADKKDIEFSVIHNIPNDFALSLPRTIDSWVMITENFTADSLCRYFNNQKTKYICKPDLKTD